VTHDYSEDQHIKQLAIHPLSWKQLQIHGIGQSLVVKITSAKLTSGLKVKELSTVSRQTPTLPNLPRAIPVIAAAAVPVRG
jgi:hypothetical protein